MQKQRRRPRAREVVSFERWLVARDREGHSDGDIGEPPQELHPVTGQRMSADQAKIVREFLDEIGDRAGHSDPQLMYTLRALKATIRLIRTTDGSETASEVEQAIVIAMTCGMRSVA